MSNISTDAAMKFVAGEKFSRDNTMVTVEDGETKLYLFGNCIARRTSDDVLITDADWATVTTHRRLSAVMWALRFELPIPLTTCRREGSSHFICNDIHLKRKESLLEFEWTATNYYTSPYYRRSSWQSVNHAICYFNGVINAAKRRIYDE